MLTRRGEYTAMFIIGAVCYGLIEILWRGSTHWTMLLTGGTCVAILHWVNQRHYSLDLWSKCGLGSLCITAVEFAVGWLVNIKLDMMVWDYSDKFLNVMGQICLEYTAYWYFLSIPVIMTSNYFIIRRKKKEVFAVSH